MKFLFLMLTFINYFCVKTQYADSQGFLLEDKKNNDIIQSNSRFLEKPSSFANMDLMNGMVTLEKQNIFQINQNQENLQNPEIQQMLRKQQAKKEQQELLKQQRQQQPLYPQPQPQQQQQFQQQQQQYQQQQQQQQQLQQMQRRQQSQESSAQIGPSNQEFLQHQLELKHEQQKKFEERMKNQQLINIEVQKQLKIKLQQIADQKIKQESPNVSSSLLEKSNEIDKLVKGYEKGNDEQDQSIQKLKENEQQKLKENEQQKLKENEQKLKENEQKQQEQKKQEEKIQQQKLIQEKSKQLQQQELQKNYQVMDDVYFLKDSLKIKLENETLSWSQIKAILKNLKSLIRTCGDGLKQCTSSLGSELLSEIDLKLLNYIANGENYKQQLKKDSDLEQLLMQA